MAISSEARFAAIQATVEASFPVQELWFLPDGRPAFTITPSPEDKVRFLQLHQALRELGVLPLMRRRDDKTVILLVPRPPAGRTPWLLAIGLFVATLVTTFLAGYENSRGGCLPGPVNPVIGGVAFSLSLMAILVCHEMGHKVVSIWRKIDSSPPFFIPLPPFSGFSIGTMGAVILTRTPAPNRDALVELGASGPIAGFVVALPILVYGVAHSLVIAHAAIVAHGCVLVSIPTPLLVNLLVQWLLHPAPSADVIIHPMAFAGWVGLLVTALNLLPASMLDGGHVTRAVLGPRAHQILSYAALVVGLFGYWAMSLVILFLIRRGHPGPLDDCSAVSPMRTALAASLVGIFILSFVPLYSLTLP
jgi:Zn-dependent protease